jgi:hypothetical protein
MVLPPLLAGQASVMVTSLERAPVNNFIQDWATESGLRARGAWDPPEPEPIPEDDPIPEPTLIPRRRAADAQAAIYAVTGLDIDLTEYEPVSQPFALYQYYDATDTDDQPTAKSRTEPAEHAEDEGGSRAYKVREIGWRVARGLPRRHRKLPPSRTTEGRRRAHISKRAAEWGVDFDEAERRIAKRPGATRRGRDAL